MNKKGGKGAPMSHPMVYWSEDYEGVFDMLIEFGAVVDLRPLPRIPVKVPILGNCQE